MTLWLNNLWSCSSDSNLDCPKMFKLIFSVLTGSFLSIKISIERSNLWRSIRLKNHWFVSLRQIADSPRNPRSALKNSSRFSMWYFSSIKRLIYSIKVWIKRNILVEDCFTQKPLVPVPHIRIVTLQKCKSVAKVSTKLNFEILFSVTLAGFFPQSAQSRVLNKWRPIQLKNYRFCSWHWNRTVQKFRKVLKINSSRYSKRLLNNHRLVFLFPSSRSQSKASCL